MDTKYKIHTSHYDIVYISCAGAQFVQVERPDNDLWVIEGVELDELKLVVDFCNDYATDAEKTVIQWNERALGQSVEWRFELKKAAEIMGVQPLVAVLMQITTNEQLECFNVCAKDGGCMKVTRGVLKMNNTLNNMVNDFGENQTVIPISTVDTPTMTHVVNFCTEYITNPPDTKSKYIEMVKGMVNTEAASLITAADFLSNVVLLDVCARGIAARIESLTIEEMKEYVLGHDNNDTQMEVP